MTKQFVVPSVQQPIGNQTETRRLVSHQSWNARYTDTPQQPPRPADSSSGGVAEVSRARLDITCCRSQADVSQDLREHGVRGRVSALDVASALDCLQRLQFHLGRGSMHSGEREHRGARVEPRAAIGEHLVAIKLRKGLPRQLGDALVVRPGVLRETIVHGTRAGSREEAGWKQFERPVAVLSQTPDRRRGSVAPATERIVDESETRQMRGGCFRHHSENLRSGIGSRKFGNGDRLYAKDRQYRRRGAGPGLAAATSISLARRKSVTTSRQRRAHEPSTARLRHSARRRRTYGADERRAAAAWLSNSRKRRVLAGRNRAEGRRAKIPPLRNFHSGSTRTRRPAARSASTA